MRLGYAPHAQTKAQRERQRRRTTTSSSGSPAGEVASGSRPLPFPVIDTRFAPLDFSPPAH